MELPKSFNDLCIMFDNQFNFKNILCVRHPTGGMFLNKLFLNKSNVTRILYETNNIKQPKCDKGPNMLIKHSDLKNVLEGFNKKFDLICLDPFHEYYESSSDLSLLASFLLDDGILVCHDCNIFNKDIHTPYFIHKDWLGVTYYCFVEFAYNNPDYYYAVINKDCGLGIISKKEIQFVKKVHNEKQKQLIEIFKNNTDEAYDYFKNNVNELINLIK